MRRTPAFLLEDEAEVRRLVAENPWATIVSSPASGLVASHYPFLIDRDADRLTLLTHVGRPDETLHELGRHEVLVIVQGAHGYVSPGWYGTEEFIPTWNHVTAHLYGTPQILTDDENLRVLGELVDHFEKRMPEPRSLSLDPAYAARVARGTVGLRIPISRIDARLKLSQNKPPEVVDRIIDALEGGGPYSDPTLAREMRRVHDGHRAAE